MNDGFIKRNTAIEGGLAYFFAVVAYLVVVLVFSIVFAYVKEDPAIAVLQFVEGVIVSLSFAAVSVISNVSLKSKPIYKFEKISRNSILICPFVTLICIIGFQGPAFLVLKGLVAAGYSYKPALDFNNPLTLALTAVRIILFAPVCEEMLLRSSVLSSVVSLTDRRRPKYRLLWVVAINGALFALIHMNPLQTVYQFFFGCVLAYITIKYRSIVPAVIIHTLNNVVALALSVPAVDGAISGLVDAALAAAPGVILFVLCSFLLTALALAAVYFLVRRFVPATLPETVSESDHNSGFRTVEDDNGALVASFIYVVSAVMAAAVWITRLVGGFTG